MMILSVPSTPALALVSPVNHQDSEGLVDMDEQAVDNGFATSDHPEVSIHPNIDEVLRQLFHMTLASVEGYRELASLAAQPELREYLDVIARQRSAQCRALAQMSGGLIPVPVNFEPAGHSTFDAPNAVSLQLSWVRAIWTFEQDQFVRFSECLDQAEMALEDAFLTAAEAFSDSEFGANFQQYAINICGARQCLEDVTRGCIPTGRY